MKITLGDIKTAESALRTLVNKTLPIRMAYRLGKLVKEVDSELSVHETERVKLVKKYGKDDDKGNFNVSEENYTVFFEAMAKLNSLEVELKYEAVNLDDLGNINMTPLEMMQLGPFIA